MIRCDAVFSGASLFVGVSIYRCNIARAQRKETPGENKSYNTPLYPCCSPCRNETQGPQENKRCIPLLYKIMHIDIEDILTIFFNVFTLHDSHPYKVLQLYSHVRVRRGQDYMSRDVRKRILAYVKTKTQISFTVTAKLVSASVFSTW